MKNFNNFNSLLQNFKMRKTLILIFLLGATSVAFSQEKNDTLKWTDAMELGMEGRGWNNDSLYYNRLPSKAEGIVPPSVWNLSKQTAGLYVHFISDANTIKAKWGLTSDALGMPHFAPTGVSGLDLYVKMPNNSWHWLGVGKPKQVENIETLVEGMPVGKREYLLYLPLYNGIKYLEIGIPQESQIEKAPPFSGKPIVFYGTSIIQGGCASRAGMCSTAILGRRLNREIINLGFSGSGRMEPELATFLSELDPAIYFIDCMPNLKADEIAVRVEPFIRILRKVHPETPIVLAEGVIYNDAFLVKDRYLKNTSNNEALRNAYENLIKSGVRNLYYQIAEGQVGLDGEGTVDGVHLTDLGFMRQADAYELILRCILHQ
jgi:hypothetical protein